MTSQEARAHFDAAIARTDNKDQIANIEIAREYFTNPTFRANLEQFIWDINNAK